MALSVGEKVHVVERRRFDGDVRRHFVGEVDRTDGATVRVTGHVFIYDGGSASYVRNAGRRTRVISLADSGNVINVIPADTVIDDVRYEEVAGRLTVTDGSSFSLDVNEFGRMR